jgi:4-hydroxy-tetrahydrodipicolinate reductase
LTRELASRQGYRVVGAVDLDQALTGADVGTLAGLPAPLGVKVEADANALLRRTAADVVLVTTSSDLESLLSQIRPFLEAGLHVVSTCEELAYPFVTQPDCAEKIDDLARHNRAVVLGTGVNPGFLMDLWPLVATAVVHRVDAIRIDRIQDAAQRRLPFQRKIGAGLTPDEFAAKVEAGTLRHVGLTESMQMIAHRLGWELTRTEDVVEPVIAASAVKTADLEIAPGNATGVEQVGKGFIGEREVLTLRFRAVVGEGENRDTVRIEGEPPLRVEIPGGVNGDAATCNIMVNAIHAVQGAPPGLRHMADIPPITWQAHKGEPEKSA